MVREEKDVVEQEMGTVGVVVDGVDEPCEEEMDEYGTRWTAGVREYNTNW